MLGSIDTIATVALAVVATTFLIGVGAFVGSLASRRTPQQPLKENKEHKDSERPPPQKVVRELEQCLELGSCVARDADSVSTMLEEQSSSLPPELLGAMQQLIKTTKSLSGRLQRVEDETSLGTPEVAKPAAPRSTSSAPTETKQKANSPAHAAAKDKEQPKPIKTQHAESDEARRFPRSPCHGNLKATIYPPPSSPGGEPFHCTVLTRDLSCGGIGIAHSEQLYPRQIVVLDAVGKLLVGEVRWCRQLDEKFFIAGCRLVKTSD